MDSNPKKSGDEVAGEGHEGELSTIIRKQQILEDLERKTLDQCNVSFLLMAGIPLTVFVYLLGIKLFSWDIMIGIAGDLLLVAFLSSVVGLVFSRVKLKAMINLIVSYNKLLIEKEKEIHALKHQYGGLEQQ